MAKAVITLEIVTPDGVALSEQVEGLTAPSVEGEFGVYPGHRPLLAALRTGLVSYDKEGHEVRVAVGPGFVEVFEDKALLLTDRFITKDQVDAVQTRLDLKDADEDLARFSGEPGSPEHAELISKELWAATKLELYGDPPPPTMRVFNEFQIAAREDFVKAFHEGDAADAAPTPAKHD
jgi:F-type H+-transporting ATPase subunit epsilon